LYLDGDDVKTVQVGEKITLMGWGNAHVETVEET
jgi:hypothetical protein